MKSISFLSTFSHLSGIVIFALISACGGGGGGESGSSGGGGNGGGGSGGGSPPPTAAPLLFLSADNGQTGYELYRTDGTDIGTTLVKDINTNAHSDPDHFTTYNGTTYFTARTNEDGVGLWKTDGTENGTALIMANSVGLTQMKVAGNTLYFNQNSGLWKTDGTAAGTSRVDAATNSVGFIIDFTVLGNTLIFSTYNGTTRTLWRSDGTRTGTVTIASFPNVPAGYSLSNLVATDTTVFFTVNDSANGEELWRSDGTNAFLVKNIRVGNADSSPINLTPIGDTLFFRAVDDTPGVGLWISTGTESSTQKIYSTNTASSGLDFLNMTAHQGLLYFSNGPVLYRSNGTIPGTYGIASIPGESTTNVTMYNLRPTNEYIYFTGPISKNIYKYSFATQSVSLVSNTLNTGILNTVTTVGNTLYFAATSMSNSFGNYNELWTSNGTTAGTVQVKEIHPGTFGSDPQKLFSDGQRLYFVASDGVHGRELWVSNGTDAGTYMVRDIKTTGADSRPEQLVQLGGIWYFVANDGSHFGTDLWRTDATPDGTYKVKLLNDDRTHTVIQELTVFNNALYFSATTAEYGKELWKSNGTAAGTEIVKDIYPGSIGSNPTSLTIFAGRLYFVADSDTARSALWVSDGTVNGTTMIKANPNRAMDAFVDISQKLVTAGNLMYFSATLAPARKILWKSDGTPPGTAPVLPNSFDEPKQLTAAGNTLYYTSGIGDDLWKSNGTEINTINITGTLSPRPSQISNLASIGDTLYFTAQTTLLGNELWKSNGAANTTVMVKDIYNNFQSSDPFLLTPVGNTLYFFATSQSTGTVLWQSQGTDATTTSIVTPLMLFSGNLFSVGNTVYLGCSTVGYGEELCRVDSASKSILRVTDLNPGTASSFNDILVP